MAITLQQREALEQRFDGRIPAHLLNPKTEAELMADHHRAMIRFNDNRIGDFQRSLEKLLAGPQGPATDAWIVRTRRIIEDHFLDRARHAAAISAGELGIADEVQPLDPLAIAAE